MANTYLTRTPSGSGDNRRIWTLSTWVKRSVTGSGGVYYSQGTTTGALAYIGFNSTDLMEIAFDTETSGNFRSDMKFRDLSAWYHIVIACDTTQATASNRVKAWVNGSQITFGTESQPSQNYETQMNTATLIELGKQSNGAGYFFNGLLSHYHFIDGTAYDASAFGSTDATTGEWKINTSPSVTYGTNGFFILKDGNSGTDASTNSNNFTVGGGTLTKTEDCPSNVFATLNPLDKGNTVTAVLANGNNTTMASSGLGDYGLRSTLGASSGKYYFEVKVNGGNTQTIGDMDARLVINMNDSSPTSAFYGFQRYSNSSTNLYNNGTFVSQNTAMWGGITAGDIISFAVDLDNSKVFLQKNGTGWKNTSGATGDPVNGTNPTFTIADATKTYGFYCELRNNADNETQMNFGNGFFGTQQVASAGTNASGNGIFEYDVPTGYTALSTKGLNL